MKTAVYTAGLIVAIGLSAATLSAQWPTTPTSGVPRLATGEPNLDAPAPRTPDGKPDLAGLWRGVGSAFGPGARRGGPPPPPQTGAPLAGFRDVAQNLPGGLPLTPYGAELLKTRTAGNSKDNPEAHCLPMGIVQLHTQGMPRKFFQTPTSLVILYEASWERREILTDGRPLPPVGEVHPWFYGYSAGHWEGDTLVVKTNNFRDGGWLDIIGSPLTDAATIVERFRRPTYGRMEIEITVEDARAYTRPFTVRVDQRLVLDDELIEFICLENQRFQGP